MHKLTQNTRTDIRSLCFEGGVDEHHAVIRIIQPMLSFREQRDNILTALRELTEGQLPGARPVFLRFFLSDAANQSGLLTEALADFPPVPVPSLSSLLSTEPKSPYGFTCRRRLLPAPFRRG